MSSFFTLSQCVILSKEPLNVNDKLKVLGLCSQQVILHNPSQSWQSNLPIFFLFSARSEEQPTEMPTTKKVLIFVFNGKFQHTCR